VSTILQRLKAHYAQYEPTLKELKSKYESLMKEKTLTRLERDRLAAKVGRRMYQGGSHLHKHFCRRTVDSVELGSLPLNAPQ
jgi:hypothetical protein